MKRITQVIFSAVLIMSTSCNRGFEPIDYGSDACSDCRMTIVDNRFAAELIDKKGKVFKFDDLLCMKNYISNHPGIEIGQLFVEGYSGSQGKPLDAMTAIYLKHDFFRSPMNGNYAAFGNHEEATPLKDSLGVQTLSWSNL